MKQTDSRRTLYVCLSVCLLIVVFFTVTFVSIHNRRQLDMVWSRVAMVGIELGIIHMGVDPPDGSEHPDTSEVIFDIYAYPVGSVLLILIAGATYFLIRRHIRHLKISQKAPIEQ